VDREAAIKFTNSLKPWITGSKLRAVAKGKDGESILNCVNFFCHV
jgi:hypothetical protein